MNRKIGKQKYECSVIFFVAVLLFILNWVFNAWMTKGTRVLYLDDLEAYSGYISFKNSVGILGYLFNTAGGKFRIVMNFITIVLFETIGKNFETLDVIQLVLNWGNCMALFLLIRKFASKSRWKNHLGVIGGALFAGSRFAYYDITEFWGIMESMAILFGLILLYFLLCYVENGSGRSWIGANIAYLIIIFIHERYVLLLGAFIVAVVGKYGKNIKKWITIILPLLIFVAFWGLRFLLLGGQVLVGTGNQNINETFNIKQAILFAFSQIGYILGLNCGPAYLNGIDMRDVPWNLNSIILMGIIIVGVIIVKALKQWKENYFNINQILVILSFIGCCIISSSATIRVEMRWIYISYAAFVLLLVVSFAYLMDKAENKKKWLVVGGIYLCIVFCFETFYRSHYNNIYYWNTKEDCKSLYSATVEKYGEGFYNSKTILVDSSQSWNEELWRKFFSPYFDSENLQLECVSCIVDAQSVKESGNIVLLYENGKGYMDITDNLENIKFLGGHYADGWCEQEIEVNIKSHGKSNLIIQYYSPKSQKITIVVNGIEQEMKVLETGYGNINIELNGDENTVNLKSNYAEKLSDPDQRVCSYQIIETVVE